MADEIILAEPAQADSTTFEFCGGEVQVQYEPAAAGAMPWNVGIVVVTAGG